MPITAGSPRWFRRQRLPSWSLTRILRVRSTSLGPNSWSASPTWRSARSMNCRGRRRLRWSASTPARPRTVRASSARAGASARAPGFAFVRSACGGRCGGVATVTSRSYRGIATKSCDFRALRVLRHLGWQTDFPAASPSWAVGACERRRLSSAPCPRPARSPGGACNRLGRSPGRRSGCVVQRISPASRHRRLCPPCPGAEERTRGARGRTSSGGRHCARPSTSR
jgi:hypothetical protein